MAADTPSASQGSSLSPLRRLLQHRDSSLTCRHLWRELPTPASLSLLVLLDDVGAVRVLPREFPTAFLGPVPYLWFTVLSRRNRRTCQPLWGGFSRLSCGVLLTCYAGTSGVGLLWLRRVGSPPFTYYLELCLPEDTSGPSLLPIPSCQGFVAMVPSSHKDSVPLELLWWNW